MERGEIRGIAPTIIFFLKDEGNKQRYAFQPVEEYILEKKKQILCSIWHHHQLSEEEDAYAWLGHEKIKTMIHV